MLEPDKIHDRLKVQFPDGVLDLVAEPLEPYSLVRPLALPKLAAFLKSDPELAFNYLVTMSSVDQKETLSVFYHLSSVDLLSGNTRHTLLLKTDVPRDDPVIGSVSHVWATASWQERECFDLMGIRFDGHPDLRRILTEEDWVGHPLRKDYVFPTEYRGIDLS